MQPYREGVWRRLSNSQDLELFQRDLEEFFRGYHCSRLVTYMIEERAGFPRVIMLYPPLPWRGTSMTSVDCREGILLHEHEHWPGTPLLVTVGFHVRYDGAQLTLVDPLVPGEWIILLQSYRCNDEKCCPRMQLGEENNQVVD